MLQIETFDELETAVTGYFQVEFPDEDFAPDSYHGKWARVLALFLWSLKASVQDADAEWPPSDASSEAAIEAACFLLGLPNGAGGYGRRVAQPASGGLAQIGGTLGTAFAQGLRALGPDNQTLFQLDAGTIIPGVPPGHAAVSVSISAVTPGTSGNLAAGSTLRWVIAPAGADPTFTLTQKLVGGSDLESTAAALARIYDRLQNPPKGGAAPDWRSWAGTIAKVLRCYLYPIRNGTGTVDAVIAQAGSGLGRAPGADVLAGVAVAFDANRLVCVEGRRVFAPYMPPGAACRVVIRPVPLPAFAFDWNSAGLGLTVAGYNGAGPSLTLSAAAPVDFQAAVNANKRPRLQVVTSGVVLPQQARVVAYNALTHECTLEAASLPSAWSTSPPQLGDAVHAGGPVVDTIAAAVLALVDSLGPSRVSKFADKLDAWDDTLRVDRLVEIAMGAADASGARMVADLAADPTINGVAANKQAADNTPQGPQLLYLASCAVAP